MELSEVSLRDHLRRQQPIMRTEVQPKMVQLIDLLQKLSGDVQMRKIDDRHTVRFRSWDTPAKSPDELTSLSLTETVDGQEKLRVSAYITRYGATLLMDAEPGRSQGVWARDSAFEEDIKEINEQGLDATYHIIANRYREIRMAARMMRLLLGEGERS